MDTPTRTMDARGCAFVTLVNLPHGRDELRERFTDELRSLMEDDGVNDRSEHLKGASVSVGDRDVPMQWHTVDQRAERRIVLAESTAGDLSKLGLTHDGPDARYWTLGGAAFVVTADGGEAWAIPLAKRGDRTCQALAGRSTRKRSALTSTERSWKRRAEQRGATEAEALAEVDRRRAERELAKAGRHDAGHDA